MQNSSGILLPKQIHSKTFSLISPNIFRMFKLETQLKQRDEKILQLGFEKKFLDNLRKEQTKTIETLLQDKNFLLKVLLRTWKLY